MPDDELVFNGINGATGGYLLPPVTAGQVTAIAKGSAPDKEHLRDLERRYRQPGAKFRGVREGVDPQDLSQAGWGIIFALQDQEKVPAIKDALGELLARRREQAGERYREFSGPDGLHPGESKSEFLARHGVGPGPAVPERVPYYLLIVADPEAIPYLFQYQLDVQYAVGRLYFDELEDYARYAHSLAAIESGPAGLPRRAVFLGVQNEADQATRLSATRLVQPLAARMEELQADRGWQVDTMLGEAATKAALADQFGAVTPPALLFTASHGMGFPRDDPRQVPHQGALLCQDWPGPLAWREPIPPDFYFSGEDIGSQARLSGSMAFQFACYGAGTPRQDDFAERMFRAPAEIARRAFVACLPQCLLAHPNGGMAAVIGHVERAWGYSFSWEKTDSQLAVFESALKRIMDGYPVGYAMEYFNERYAELSTLLSSELQGARYGKLVDELALAGLWTANNDARSYVILGDPAARLAVLPPEQHFVPALASAPLELTGGEFQAVRQPVSGEGYPPPAAGLESTGTTGASRQIDELALALETLPVGTPEWAQAQQRLGEAFSALRTGEGDANLRAAIQAYQAALSFYSPDQHPDWWAALQGWLADLHAELYARTGEPQEARLAEETCRALIAACEGDRAGLAGAYLRLGNLLARRFARGQDQVVAGQALAAYRQALQLLERERQPFSWALAHFELARLQLGLHRASLDESYRSGALADLRSALEVFTLHAFPVHAAQAQALLDETGEQGS